jgi:hypothetical protein
MFLRLIERWPGRDLRSRAGAAEAKAGLAVELANANTG